MISEIIFGGITIGILSLLIIFGTHFLVDNENKILKIQKLFFLHPNTISFLRIPIGLISLILFHYKYYYIALIIFTFAVFSDYSDGVIARSCKLETELGKSLDPMADKIVYFLPLLYFGFVGKINMILLILFIIIDSIGQISRIFLKKMQKETKANIFGKVKTIFVFTFLFYFFLVERFFVMPSIISSLFLVLFSVLSLFSILRRIF